MDQSCFDIIHLPNDARRATKYVVEIILHNVYPLLKKLWKKLQYKVDTGCKDENMLFRCRDIYMLCASQIKKCVLNLLEVFKIEHQRELHLQETRQFILERLICCFEKLYLVEEQIEESTGVTTDDHNDSLLITTMYFVNWIDQTFEILSKLSSVIHTTDKKGPRKIEEWKDDVIDCVSGLHKSVDELLLSAMTLCRYCLPSDQPVVKVRCQVVLRETKALIGDLIEGDLDNIFHATVETLKLPIMPSIINLLIDVLKDVLYVLETNTNTALLALLVHCFSCSTSPVDALRHHLKSKTNNVCPCNVSYDDVTECCTFVKDFDLYNERLVQIASFAISCSSDEKRVLSLKSSLASLEALDPHLVPALTLAPDSIHSGLLVDFWNLEVTEIKNNVFLIVDPTAFSDKLRFLSVPISHKFALETACLYVPQKVKQMLHQILLDINKENCYNNAKVCSAINMGCVVYEFFNTYSKYEPEAVDQSTELLPILANLNKVQLECKAVSDALSSGTDMVYKTKKSKSIIDVSFAQLQKRLKLLYTLVTRINLLLNPKENDQHFYEEDHVVESRNVTKTLFCNGVKSTNSPRKPLNTISRSNFTRTVNIRSSTAKFPLATLTKNLKVKQFKDLSFSLKLDDICDLSPNNKSKQTMSILYHSPMKTRSSLRKVVLNRQCMALHNNQDGTRVPDSDWEKSMVSDKESLMDDAMSLQITEILNQVNEMTNISTAPRIHNITSTTPSDNENHSKNKDMRNNVLRLAINNENSNTLKRVWNISVNSSDSLIGSASLTSNITQPSNITTLDRINDLEFVENKLSELLTLQMETNL